MKYSGCIIEESLKDKSIINEFNITQEINDDGIIWIVEIDESKIDDIVPRLQAAMTDEPIWYCDLKCEDYHYIIITIKFSMQLVTFPSSMRKQGNTDLKEEFQTNSFQTNHGLNNFINLSSTCLRGHYK